MINAILQQKRTSHLMLVCVVLITCGVSATAAFGQDWPRFRGPNGTGISHSKTIPIDWKDEHFRWKVELPGSGSASPIVVGKRIYCLCCDPETARRRIVCLHCEDGRVLWQREYESTPHHLHSDTDYASSTPVADESGVVFVWATPEQLLMIALDKQGDEVWRRDLGPYKSLWGHATSPIMVDDTVILLNDQMNPSVMKRFMPEGMKVTEPGISSLIALDRATGKTRWKRDRATVITGYATPCVRENSAGNQEILFVGTAKGITGVDPTTGNINWQVNGLMSRTVMCPIVAGDLILATHGTGLKGDQLIAVRPNLDNEAGEVIYENKRSMPLVPNGIYVDGLVFLISDAGVATCMSAKTGNVHWQRRLGGNYYASLVCINKRLYAISRTGTVTVFDAKRKFNQLAEMSLDAKCFATPAIADGVMYIRTDSHLFAITKQKP